MNLWNKNKCRRCIVIVFQASSATFLQRKARYFFKFTSIEVCFLSVVIIWWQNGHCSLRRSYFALGRIIPRGFTFILVPSSCCPHNLYDEPYIVGKPIAPTGEVPILKRN